MKRRGTVLILGAVICLAGCASPPTQDEVRDRMLSELSNVGGTTEESVHGMINTIAGDMLTDGACDSEEYRGWMGGGESGKLLAAFDATCAAYFD